MSTNGQTLTSRREFLFLYDIKMGNPNGDPDENRPRVLPDGTHYVTDVRLKRFVRDYLKSQGLDILVDSIEGKTTNLTGRVAHFLVKKSIQKVEGADKIVEIMLESFIDARLFGSSFAFKQDKAKGKEKDKESSGKKEDEPKGKGKSKGKAISAKVILDGNEKTVEWVQPKTLTGAVQINHGEVKHPAQEVDIHGTSVFGSAEEKTQGTFTTYYALRYALIGFNGVANEHSAKLSRMTDGDYDTLLRAMWNGVRSAGNTRTKYGQVPRLLLSVVYKPGVEFQFGNLADYVTLTTKNGKPPKEWSLPGDYTVDLTTLALRLQGQADKVDTVYYCVSPDAGTTPGLTELGLPQAVTVKDLQFDGPVK